MAGQPGANVLTRVQSRKAEDALLTLSTTPEFPLMTRVQIAEKLSTILSSPIKPTNLNLLAEAINVTLPSNRGNASHTPDVLLRLRRVEDAITFILKNFGAPPTRGTLDQPKIVTDNWIHHLSTVRSDED